MTNLFQLLLNRLLPFALLIVSPHIASHLPEQTIARGKVMSQKANKLQAPILDNLIYSRRPFLKKVINSSKMTTNSCERYKLKIIAYFDVNKQ